MPSRYCSAVKFGDVFGTHSRVCGTEWGTRAAGSPRCRVQLRTTLGVEPGRPRLEKHGADDHRREEVQTRCHPDPYEQDEKRLHRQPQGICEFAAVQEHVADVVEEHGEHSDLRALPKDKIRRVFAACMPVQVCLAKAGAVP